MSSIPEKKAFKFEKRQQAIDETRAVKMAEHEKRCEVRANGTASVNDDSKIAIKAKRKADDVAGKQKEKEARRKRLGFEFGKSATGYAGTARPGSKAAAPSVSAAQVMAAEVPKKSSVAVKKSIAGTPPRAKDATSATQAMAAEVPKKTSITVKKGIAGAPKVKKATTGPATRFEWVSKTKKGVAKVTKKRAYESVSENDTEEEKLFNGRKRRMSRAAVARAKEQRMLDDLVGPEGDDSEDDFPPPYRTKAIKENDKGDVDTANPVPKAEGPKIRSALEIKLFGDEA